MREVTKTWLTKSLACADPRSNVPSGLKLIFDRYSIVPKLFLSSMLPLAVKLIRG